MKTVEIQLFFETVSPVSNSSEIVQFIGKRLKTYSDTDNGTEKVTESAWFPWETS